MDRSGSILLGSTSNQTTTISHFIVSPYKIAVSVVIHVFCEERESKRDIGKGQFCLLIMKLIQGLDCNYDDFIKEISPPKLSNEFNKKVIDKLNKIKDHGTPQLMELINNIKQLLDSKVQKSSIVGLFIRRMWLYFDKLSFSAVSQLFHDYFDYLQRGKHKSSIKQVLFQQLKTETCPQQMQYFISKQMNLIQINEKLALSPNELLEAIKLNCDDGFLGLSSPQNEFNDLHFLKYMNSLRINEFPAAKESLMAYFDGNNIPRCWAALSLAILHLHFKHNELALESLKECISTAQESNDEKCLEYALLWISKVLNRVNADENVTNLLNHLQTKANEMNLPYISSVAQLEADNIKTTTTKLNNNKKLTAINFLSTTTPDILAVKHSMSDVLMMCYASRAAIMYYYGANHLAALTSQVLLHLHVTEPVGHVNVYHINENTCICIRNLALHLWNHFGQYQLACEMLLNISFHLSSYKSDLNSIWRQALAEIEFEHNLNQCKWKNALNFIKVIQIFDKFEAKYRMIQLKIKQGERLEAIELLNEILSHNKTLNMRIDSKIRLLLLKGKILNDLTLLLECVDLAKQNHLTGFECSCLVELANMLNQLDQLSQSQHILSSIMIKLLANGTIRDIGNAFRIEAVNYYSIYQRNPIENADHLESARISNEKAIEIWRSIDDKQLLKEALTLQANIYNHKQDFAQRNFYARQVRLIEL